MNTCGILILKIIPRHRVSIGLDPPVRNVYRHEPLVFKTFPTQRRAVIAFHFYFIFYFFVALSIDNKRVRVCRDYGCLPTRNPDGYQIIYHKLRLFEANKYVFNDGVRLLVMAVDACAKVDGTCPGYIFLFDMRGVRLGHLTRLSISSLRKFFTFIQVRTHHGDTWPTLKRRVWCPVTRIDVRGCTRWKSHDMNVKTNRRFYFFFFCPLRRPQAVFHMFPKIMIMPEFPRTRGTPPRRTAFTSKDIYLFIYLFFAVEFNQTIRQFYFLDRSIL